jgi:hypothetical protein
MRSATRIVVGLGAILFGAGGCGIVGVGERSGAPVRLGVYGPASVYTEQTSLGGDPAQNYLYDPFQQPYGEPPNSYRAYPGVALVQPRPPAPVRPRPTERAP